MKSRILFSAIALLSLFIFQACDSPKEKALHEINALEAKDSVFSPELINKLGTAYLEFAEKYPDDEMAPAYILKAAQQHLAIGEHQQALELFKKIRENYPKHKLAEEALFLQGYIYENRMNDMENAKKIYSQFINEYPNSELAEDAKISMNHLGETPEELWDKLNIDSAQAEN